MDDQLIEAIRTATWSGRCRHQLTPHTCPTCGPEVAAAVAKPLVAAHVLRSVSGQIANRVNELRDEYRSGPVSIDYINGMEDADTCIERAIAHHELTAQEATR